MHDSKRDTENVKQGYEDVVESGRWWEIQVCTRLPLLSQSSRLFTRLVCDWKVKNMHLCAERTIERIL